MKLSVKMFRDEEMEARWGRTHVGAPCMFVRDPAASLKHQRESWWMVTQEMWDSIAGGENPRDAFHAHTMLGDIFSIPA